MNSKTTRRTSRGKSDFIEYSLLLLDNVITTQGSLSNIQFDMNNNTLPCEIRSIAWRLFLNVLPKQDSTKWIQITEKNREIYSKKKAELKHKNCILKIIQNNNNITIEEKEVLESDEYKYCSEALEFLNDLVEVYDLFKKDVFKETLVYIYIIYRLNTSQFKFSSAAILTLLSSIIYTLYSSMSHNEIDYNDILEKSVKEHKVQLSELFHFINHEAHFEHDIYSIYESILELHGQREIILKLNEESTVRDIYLSTSTDETLDSLNSSLMELLLLIIGSQKPKIIDHFRLYQLDLCMVFKYWTSTFFSSSFMYNDCAYLMDIIICNEEQIMNEEVILGFLNNKVKFHFLYFIISSFICYYEDTILKIKDLKELNDYFLMMHERSFDLKQILQKAIKSREAMALIYNK